MSEPMSRLFVAVDIPPPDAAVSTISGIKKADIPFKTVEPETSHVSLRFLGDTPRGMLPELEVAMKKALGRYIPFEVGLKGLGIFGSPRSPRVLWVGLDDDGVLGKMANSIDLEFSQLGILRKTRPFRAHLTLGRFKGGRGGPPKLDRRQADTLEAALEEQREADFGVHTIERVLMKKSVLRPKGPVHSDEITIQLHL